MSKMKKSVCVKLIANPGAGKASDAPNRLKLVTGFLKSNGLKVDVALVKTKEKATPIAKKAIKAGYQIIIAMGGDGTVEAVMRGMIGSKARLGIIPAGEENKIARSYGIPLDFEKACALIATENKRKLDAVQVKNDKGKKFVFFETAKVGFPAGQNSGKNEATKADTTLSKETPAALPKIVLTLDGKAKIEIESMLVTISHTTVVGKNFMETLDASLPEGLFDISVYPDFDNAELHNYYAALMDGGYAGKGKIQHYQASKLKVKTSPKLEVTADGVSMGKGKATFKVVRNAVRVIAVENSPITETAPKEIGEIKPEPVSEAVKKVVSKKA